MNLPRPAAFLGCVLLLLINGCSPPPARQSDAAARQGSTTDSALKSFLDPLFASQDGKDPLADPEYREDMRAQWRLSTEAKYAWLVRKLKLSPELTDQLYDLLVEQIFESLEGPVQSLRSENGVPVLTPEYQALKDKQDRAIGQLIGEAGFAQFREYDATFEYRNEVNRLQLHFVVGTEVLRDDQVDAMIAVLRDAGEKLGHSRPTGMDYTGVTREEWQRLQAKDLALRLQHDSQVLEAAASVLAPAQYAALDANIQLDQANWELIRVARGIVPAGKSAVARDPRDTDTHFLIGANDDRLVQDPEYRHAWLLQKRLEMESTYVDAPPLLKLSPGLADRLFSLLVEQQLARVESPTHSAAAADERQRREQQELSALLGDRVLAQFQELQDSYASRRQVKQLQIDIGAGPDALKAGQVEALVPILEEANLEMQRASPSLLAHFFTTRRQRELLSAQHDELRRRRDARIRESAAAILTPPQLAALDAWFHLDPS